MTRFFFFLGIILCMGNAPLSFSADEDPPPTVEDSADTNTPGTDEGSKDHGAGNAIKLNVSFPADGEETTIRTIDSDGKRKGAVVIMEDYIGKFFLFGSGLVAIIAVLWIIVGGFQIMFSGAMSTEITAGKDKITKALMGLVLVFISALILHTINPGFFKI